MHGEPDSQEPLGRDPLIIVVSPYHLTTRQPPALVGPLLADHVVTMMPTPSKAGQGHDEVRRAVMEAPKYLRFMESWRWSTALWDAGVIAPVFDGDDAVFDVHDAIEIIGRDEMMRPLRPFMRRELFGDERMYLETIAADILKGGPDPAISIPVAAGLDRFGARNALTVMRSETTSVAQRAEAELWEKLFAMVVPVVVQADGGALVRIRRMLGPGLDSLRGLLADACSQVVEGGAGALEDGFESELKEAARVYSEAFEQLRPEIQAAADDDEVRIVCAAVNITATALPVDAVLRSSLVAAGAMAGGVGRGRGGSGGREGKGGGANLPVVWDPALSQTVFSLVVRQVGTGSGSGRHKALGRWGV